MLYEYHLEEPARLDEERIKRSFIALNVEFDWEKNPEILTRLAETGEHFQDAVDIARIIDQTRETTGDSLSEKEMLLAALLHDIGKSGPADADDDTRAAVRELFIYRTARANPAQPIADFLIAENFPDRDRLLTVLQEKLGVDPAQEKMIDFWRRHADWTWDILQNNLSQEITPEVATVAASHHILDKKNPAGLAADKIPDDAKFLEITDKYILLTLTDKYQAFRERSGLNHEQTIAIIRGLIAKSGLADEIRQKYETILKKIETGAVAPPRPKRIAS